MGKEYISPWQLACFTIGFTLGSALILKTGVQYGGRMTWVSEIVSAGLSIIVIVFISVLVKKHPGKSILQILTCLVGSTIAKLFLLYYIFFATLLAALVLYSIEDMMLNAVMTETPGWIFCLTMALAAGYVIRKGLEVTARCCEITIPLVVAVLGFMFLAALPFIDLHNLRPVFSVSLLDFTKALIITTSFPNAEVFLLASLAVHVKDPAKVLPGFLAGFVIAALFLIVRPILSIGIFSVHEATDLVYPTYMIARIIRYGFYVERVEMFLLFTWFFFIFVRVAVCILAALTGISSLLNLKDYKKLVYPFCILLVPLSINAFKYFYEISEYITIVLPFLVLPVCFVILPFLVLLSFIKCGSGKKTRE